MDTLVLSHTSALHALRHARQVYGRVPWESIGKIEQRRAVAKSTLAHGPIDWDHLDLKGFCSRHLDAPIDILVGDPDKRRRRQGTVFHVQSSALPNHALMQVEPCLYCTSPAYTALLCSRGQTLPKVYALIMELLGTYSLPADATHPIQWNGIWPDAFERKQIEQAHYRCEPATTLAELKAIAKQCPSSANATFREAVRLAIAGSASPAETVMAGMLGLPMSHGGFAINRIPGGMQLNQRIDFTARAVRMSSGMPYAICDAYIPAAKIDLEYNGAGHEEENYRVHDGQRNNGLRGMGIKCLVLNRDQMRDIVTLEAVAQTIYADAGVRFRYRSSGYRNKQAQLLNGLRAGIGLPAI